MVREIAEEHLGSIQLTESEPGRTVFTLLIRTQTGADPDPRNT
jgi:nitrogen-specific signal transduction histidine kinase